MERDPASYNVVTLKPFEEVGVTLPTHTTTLSMLYPAVSSPRASMKFSYQSVGLHSVTPFPWFFWPLQSVRHKGQWWPKG